MAESCWSSAKDNAKGTPKNSADVVMTQAPLPEKLNTLQAELEIFSTLLEIQPRAVGGIMSRKAYSRSASVSSEGSKSESFEISESTEGRQCYCCRRAPVATAGGANKPVSVKSSSASGPAWVLWKCSSSTSVRVTILASAHGKLGTDGTQWQVKYAEGRYVSLPLARFQQKLNVSSVNAGNSRKEEGGCERVSLALECTMPPATTCGLCCVAF